MSHLDFARDLRAHATDTEQRLWTQLRGHRLQALKFKRQQPLGKYIVDFICFDHKLIVELDGGQHAEAVAYDTVRDAWLRSQGFTVMRFWNNEALTNMPGVLEVIAEHCGVLTPSPQPLPREGGGAITSRVENNVGSNASTNQTPLPPRGGGAGGEGEQ